MIRFIFICFLAIAPFASCSGQDSLPMSIAVEGVMTDKKSSVAIINGHIYKTGDTIEGAEIIEITNTVVKIRYEGEVYSLPVGIGVKPPSEEELPPSVMGNVVEWITSMADKLQSDQAKIEQDRQGKLKSEKVSKEQETAKQAEAAAKRVQEEELRKIEAEKKERAEKLAAMEQALIQRKEALRILEEKQRLERAAFLEKQKTEIERQRQEKLKEEEANAERARQEKRKAEQVKAEQERQEQLKEEAAKVEHAKREKIKAEKAEAERVKQEKLKEEKAKAEQSRIEKIKAKEAKAEQIRQEKLQAEQERQEKLKEAEVKAEQAKSEKLKAEQAKIEQAKQAKIKEEKIKKPKPEAVDDIRNDKAMLDEIFNTEVKPSPSLFKKNFSEAMRSLKEAESLESINKNQAFVAYTKAAQAATWAIRFGPQDSDLNSDERKKLFDVINQSLHKRKQITDSIAIVSTPAAEDKKQQARGDIKSKITGWIKSIGEKSGTQEDLTDDVRNDKAMLAKIFDTDVEPDTVLFERKYAEAMSNFKEAAFQESKNKDFAFKMYAKAAKAATWATRYAPQDRSLKIAERKQLFEIINQSLSKRKQIKE